MVSHDSCQALVCFLKKNIQQEVLREPFIYVCNAREREELLLSFERRYHHMREFTCINISCMVLWDRMTLVLK